MWSSLLNVNHAKRLTMGNLGVTRALGERLCLESCEKATKSYNVRTGQSLTDAETGHGPVGLLGTKALLCPPFLIPRKWAYLP